MNALVLEGGGIKGAYEIGAYIALKENGIKIDGFYGSSIGSVNAAIMAAGKEEELLHLWMNIEPAIIFGFEELVSKAINEGKYDINAFISTVKTVFRALWNRGIDTEPLLQEFDKIITEEELFNSDKYFGLVTVRVGDMSPVEIYKENIPKGKLRECILASCYLPIFKAKKIIDDNYYVDGGFYDCCPINMALKHKNYDNIYAIRINGIGFSKPVIENNSNIITIQPRRKNGSVFEMKKDVIYSNIKMGYYDTLRAIKSYDGYNYVFKRIADIYLNLITRKISNREIKRIMNFFNVDTKKDAVIRALEYVLEKEKVDYFNVYNFSKMLRKYRKIKKEHFIYNFINKLKII